jgi:hypothetical protein
MKKFIIFLLLLSMCGDTSTSEVESIPESNEIIEDSSTAKQDSNIPPLPTVNFDIIEIYETKLGAELCSDATEIDSTTEECLRQYRDNLEFVFAYAEDLRVYMDDLNDYFAKYPSAFTEEFRDLFAFVSEKFSTVPKNYGIVTSTYQQRFGNSSSPSTTVSTITPTSDNYLDYRDVKIFRASTISDQHIEILTKYIQLTEQLLFTDERVRRENLYPILVVQLDSENYASASALEEEYCQYLNQEYPATFKFKCYNSEYQAAAADGSIGLFTDGGRVSGSSLSGAPSKEECCYLFISGSFDLSFDSRSQAYVTIHEMYHIFQLSNVVDFDYDLQPKITGKRIGSDNKDKPFWMEGYATYFSHLYYSRDINDFSHLENEMYGGMFSCYCGDNQPTIKERYLNGPELYNVTWESDWAVGYQVGAWFIAYLTNIHGEQTMYDFWINSQSGILFPENFQNTFGKDYVTYEKEFRNFILNSSEDELMSILPTS